MAVANELQVVENTELSPINDGVFLDVQMFEHAQRVAKMLAGSTMVPEQFRGNVGNCMIALNFASRTRLDPAMVMQKMYIIKGRPGIEGQLAIALINNSGRFTPLQFRLSGAGNNRQCTAFATERKTGETCEQTVTWGMVNAEGWNKKPGSKWNTMPDLMFQYRAAAFFGRLFCPEVLLGMMTKEELYDIDTPQTSQVKNLGEKLKALSPPEPIAEDTTKTEMRRTADAKSTDLLHKTPEWQEWLKIKEKFPKIVNGWKDPINTTQCIQAVAQVNQTVDKENV